MSATRTVAARIRASAVPVPPSIVSPISLTRSPIGAPEAAVAAYPLTVLVAPEALVTVAVSASLTAKLAATYWMR